MIKIRSNTESQKEKILLDLMSKLQRNKKLIVDAFGDGINSNGIYDLQDTLKKTDPAAHQRNMDHIKSFLSKMEKARSKDLKEFSITSEKKPFIATTSSLVSSIYNNPEKHKEKYREDLQKFTETYTKYHSTDKDAEEIPVEDEDFC